MRFILIAVFLAALFMSAPAMAEDYVLTLKDRKFEPQVLAVPAGQKVKVTLKNLDSTPAEFESTPLNREKVVSGNGEITIYVGPLEAGTYDYYDDFHRETTGTIKAQ